MGDWNLVRQTDAATEPISTADMKAHLRVDHTSEDGYIDQLIQSARRYVEDIQNRSFIDTTWDLFLDDWPRGRSILLPRAPLSSVTDVVSFDDDDTETAFAASNYIGDTQSTPGRVVLKDASQWPTLDLRAANAVRVRFVAGYGASAADVPADAVHLIRLLVTHWYDNREPELIGSISKSLPRALEALLAKDRLVLRV